MIEVPSMDVYKQIILSDASKKCVGSKFEGIKNPAHGPGMSFDNKHTLG